MLLLSPWKAIELQQWSNFMQPRLVESILVVSNDSPGGPKHSWAPLSQWVSMSLSVHPSVHPSGGLDRSIFSYHY